MRRRRAAAVKGSVPGARPSPSPTRPGWSVASVPICSAITRGAWLGSMMPPLATPMRLVAASTCPMRTVVAEER